MTQAKIIRLVKDRGFGFAVDEGGQQYFFHYSAINPRSRITFDDLHVDMLISFEAVDADKGPRAVPRSLVIVDSPSQASSVSATL